MLSALQLGDKRVTKNCQVHMDLPLYNPYKASKYRTYMKRLHSDLKNIYHPNTSGGMTGCQWAIYIYRYNLEAPHPNLGTFTPLQVGLKQPAMEL